MPREDFAALFKSRLEGPTGTRPSSASDKPKHAKVSIAAARAQLRENRRRRIAELACDLKLTQSAFNAFLF